MAGLSAYEIARMERISANKRKLAELGLSDDVDGIAAAGKAKLARAQAKKENRKKRRKKMRPRPEAVRRSSRKRAKVKSYAEDGVAGNNALDKDSDYSDDDDDDDDDEDDDVAWDEDDEDIPFPVAYKKKKKKKKTDEEAEVATKKSAGASASISTSNGLLTIEPAKTGRSRCRGCMTQIEKGEIRVGMKAWIAGRQAVTWQKPACFLKRIAVERGKKGSRGKCKATGVKLGEGL